ncbi:MAG: hypothetical protein GYB35_03915 [Algicola sp.]|nr:hypothetical protein [Algicola sp.]
MSKKYNVLWIDDQHESLDAVHRTATDFDIKLWPYKSMNGGCGELEANLSKYDAVLLDAKFFENETDVPGTEDTRWVHQAKDRIRDLDNTLAYFVLTGQAKTYASPEFNNAFPHVFNKGVDKDEDELFKMLVDACANRETTKLKHKYNECFEVFEIGTIDLNYQPLLIDILSSLENQDFRKKNFSVMRDLFEASLIGLISIGCIPAVFLNQYGLPNHEWCAIYLEERDTRLPDNSIHKIQHQVPKANRAMVRKLKESLSKHQHLGDNEILKYEFLSNSNLMLEYLIWLANLHKTYYV